MVTTQWLQLDQILPLSVKGVACLATPPYNFARHLPFILHVYLPCPKSIGRFVLPITDG